MLELGYEGGDCLTKGDVMSKIAAKLIGLGLAHNPWQDFSMGPQYGI